MEGWVRWWWVGAAAAAGDEFVLTFGCCVAYVCVWMGRQFFSARAGSMGSEKLWGKGFVLVSVNHESTFGRSFAAVVRMLSKASRPTSVCFRWFQGASSWDVLECV